MPTQQTLASRFPFTNAQFYNWMANHDYIYPSQLELIAVEDVHWRSYKVVYRTRNSSLVEWRESFIFISKNAARELPGIPISHDMPTFDDGV